MCLHVVHNKGNLEKYGEPIIIRIYPRRDVLVSLHRAQFMLMHYPPARRCTATLTESVYLPMTCPVVHSSHIFSSGPSFHFFGLGDFHVTDDCRKWCNRGFGRRGARAEKDVLVP